MLELSSPEGDSFRCLITNSGAITVILKGHTYNVGKTHPKYNEIRQAICDRNIKVLNRLLNTEQHLRAKFASVSGKVEVKNGSVYYNGEIQHSHLVDRILDFYNAGLPFAPLVKFMEKLFENPSKRAVDELFGFLNHQNIPICDDGDFLCYKTLRSDYFDKYSGKILNKVGSIIEIPRNQVNDDCTQTCAAGYHVGALEYAGPGGWYNREGDKVVVVKVNPRDAVSVPTDHSAQKLRVCRYEVLRDYDEKLDGKLYKVENDNLNKYDDYEDEEDDDWDEDYCKECDESLDSCDCGLDTRDNYKTQKRDKNGRFIKNN